MSSWEQEKAQFEERIAELELQLVEAMERSANPMRSMDLSQTGRVKELEKQLAEAEAATERQLADAEAQWRKEEARLHLEVDRARKAVEKAASQGAPPPPADTSPALPAKKKGFASKLRAKFDSSDTPDAAPAAWPEEKARLEARIAELEAQAAGGAGEAENLDEIGSELAAAREFHQEQEEAWARQREALEKRIAGLESERSPSGPPTNASDLIEALEAADLDRERLEKELQAAKASPGAASDPELQKQRDAARAEVQETARQLEEAVRKIETSEKEWSRRKSALEARVEDLEELLGRSNEGAAEAGVADSNLRRELTEAKKSLSQNERALRKAEDAHRSAERDWNVDRESLQSKVGHLETALEETRSKLEEAQQSIDSMRAEVEAAGVADSDLREEMKELRTALGHAERALEDARKTHEADTSAWNQERSKFESRSGDLENQLATTRSDLESTQQSLEAATAEWEIQRADLENKAETLGKDLESAGRSAEKERARFEKEIAEVRGDLESARAEAADREKQLQEEMAQAAQALESARSGFEEERGKLQDEQAQARQALDDANAAALAEQERLGNQLAETSKAFDAIREELQASEKAREELAAEAATERARLEAEIASAREAAALARSDADGDRESMGRELSSAREELAQVRDQTAGEKEALEKTVAGLEAAGQLAAEAAATEREEFEKQLARLTAKTAESEEARSEAERRAQELSSKIEQLEATVAAMAEKIDPGEFEAVRGELLDKLAGAEARLEAAAREHDDAMARRQEEFGAARDTWESEKARLESALKKAEASREKPKKPSGITAAAVPDGAIAGEIERIDKEIEALTALIDDPRLALSEVMRKNVQKSELVAYRRGLLFIGGEKEKAA